MCCVDFPAYVFHGSFHSEVWIDHAFFFFWLVRAPFVLARELAHEKGGKGISRALKRESFEGRAAGPGEERAVGLEGF